MARVKAAEHRSYPPVYHRKWFPVLDSGEPDSSPTARPTAFNHPGWLFEPKYDGFRGMVYLTRQSCTVYSKRGNVLSRFRDLAEQVWAELPKREVILDGEVVAIDDEGRVNFWD